MSVGSDIYSWIKQSLPIKRTLAGPGYDETLNLIRKEIPNLIIHEYKSGTQIFDWTVPPEWHLEHAYIKNSSGETIIDSDNSSLHVLGYSEPVNKILSLEELSKNVFTLENLPDAIPYVASFYDSNWGFCMSDKQFKSLKEDQYEVVIKAKKNQGVLKTAEFYKKGKSKKEIIFSTYLCHPEMVNNELAAPAILTFMAKLLAEKETKYSYRFLFNVETIGTLCYINKNLKSLNENVIAGFVLTCFGDDATPNIIPSRYGNSLADSFAHETLDKLNIDYNTRSYFEKGSEERQYTHPNIDLPFVTITRSLFREYKEYHTSLDNLDIVSPESLESSFNIVDSLIKHIEDQPVFISSTIGEPFLSKRNLYAGISFITKSSELREELSTKIVNLNAFCDGKNSLKDLYNHLPYGKEEIDDLIKISLEHKLIREISD